MEPSELLQMFAEVLERLEIPYRVTGSMASLRPRSEQVTTLVNAGRFLGALTQLRSPWTITKWGRHSPGDYFRAAA